MRNIHAGILVAGVLGIFHAGAPRAAQGGEDPTVLFLIGRADGHASEFGLIREGFRAFPGRYPGPVLFTVGKNRSEDWPFIHPAPRDIWAGGRTHTFTVRFRLSSVPAAPLYFILGIADAHSSERSKVCIEVNDRALPPQTAPAGETRLAFEPFSAGTPESLIFDVPPGLVREGENTISIRLEDESWIIYDYTALRTIRKPLDPALRDGPGLLEEALALPGVKDIVFAVREPGKDGHWYANFGTYAAEPERCAYGKGGRLCRLDLKTRQVEVLLDDLEGAVRDPQVHYDGGRILFSYRKGGTGNYHLYEIDAAGGSLRQLTDGPYDDIEPTYLPDGDIIFVSSRANRWVNCWLTKVAILYRCDGRGGSLRMISSNNEHDNTPWVLPDGRILYTRWEYVDRSQVHFHHLWSANPDGTNQMVYFGNMNPGITMIDAKPIPGTEKVLASFSPGHGQREHAGRLTIIDPRTGPDDLRAARTIYPDASLRDPYPLSERLFLAARGAELLLLDEGGRVESIFRLPPGDRSAGLHCHEPAPIRPRQREPVIPSRVAPERGTGRFILADVYDGRNMEGVRRGEIKKLLILETLPKPINFTGGMEPLSYGGTFTLERILGTVPVEADGSAHFEVPALRSVFFVALDGDDLAIKRMQSFVTAQPGEVTSCAGCHEERTRAPIPGKDLLALRRPPSRIEPAAGVPDVLDFPRDIQPILDRHCAGCHGYEATDAGGPRAGGVILTGDRGPMFSHSYFTLSALRQFADGRNLPRSNYPPRALGSGGSPLIEKIRSGHYGARLSESELKTVRLWIDTGAAYPGTYAALGTGMIGGYDENRLDRSDTRWPSTQAAMGVLAGRCGRCHAGPRALPESVSDDRDMPPWAIDYGDPRLRYSRHILYNLTRPERSLLLLAPLAHEAGGYGICRGGDAAEAGGPAVFGSAEDPDYRKLLESITAAKAKLDEIKRFDMPGFRPHPAYIRELKSYGVLPAGLGPDDPVDPYAADRKYWKSLWHRPLTTALAPASE